jgi:predicted phosphodiesterase
MRTLFIGDLHSCRPEPVEALIDELEPERTIFLGDYFDHFSDPYHD